jgi:hypothetical protein
MDEIQRLGLTKEMIPPKKGYQLDLMYTFDLSESQRNIKRDELLDDGYTEEQIVWEVVEGNTLLWLPIDPDRKYRNIRLSFKNDSYSSKSLPWETDTTLYDISYWNESEEDISYLIGQLEEACAEVVKKWNGEKEE